MRLYKCCEKISLVSLLTLIILIIADANLLKNKNFLDQYDAVFVATCRIKCWDETQDHDNCIRACLLAPVSKMGECPAVDNLTLFDSACVNACSNDSQCPEVTKCCQHSCGITCQHPQGLELIKDLPSIPTNLTVTERRRSRGIVVKWKTEQAETNGLVLYVIEERHHAGHNYAETRLGPWRPRQHSTKCSINLRSFVKPGRWYQFRVAAVTAQGSRGFSKPSRQFSTQRPRAPGRPGNLTVGPLNLWNGSLWVELRWTVPESDLPIQRYKVFWSRRLKGATDTLDSILVHHQTTPKRQTWFYLKDLQQDCQYFLQVQALAQYGRNRLKGEKAAIVLNTANFTDSKQTKLYDI